MQYLSFPFSFLFYLPKGQGTFLSRGLCHSTLGSLPWGLLFSGAQLSFHELVVSLVVDVVGVGKPSLSSYGGTPGGPQVLLCVGSNGASLTPVSPSQELEGVWPAAHPRPLRMVPAAWLPPMPVLGKSLCLWHLGFLVWGWGWPQGIAEPINCVRTVWTSVLT